MASGDAEEMTGETVEVVASGDAGEMIGTVRGDDVICHKCSIFCL